MPDNIMKKYKKGELPADYSKDTPVGNKLDMSIHANVETSTMDFSNHFKKTKEEPSGFRIADERGY